MLVAPGSFREHNENHLWLEYVKHAQWRILTSRLRTLRDEIFAGDPFAHDWRLTEAHAMFAACEPDPDGSGRRYATMKGIAFAATNSRDGTWHGYPVAWQKVPPELKDRWLEQRRVTATTLRRYKDFPEQNIRWALDSDDE